MPMGFGLGLINLFFFWEKKSLSFWPKAKLSYFDLEFFQKCTKNKPDINVQFKCMQISYEYVILNEERLIEQICLFSASFAPRPAVARLTSGCTFRSSTLPKFPLLARCVARHSATDTPSRSTRRLTKGRDASSVTSVPTHPSRSDTWSHTC